MQKQKQQTTAAYYAAFAAMGISMATLGPTLPGLAEHTRSSLSAISILFTARSLGSLVGSVWGGQLYDRLRGNPLMAVAIASMAALTALTPFAPTLWLLTAILFITGAVQGVLNIGGNALLVWLHGREVGPFMNGLHFCFGVGTFFTPIVIAQFIAQQGGLLWTYLLLAVLILPTALLAFLPSPVSPAKTKDQGGDKIDPLLVILISLVFGCYSGASAAFGGWIFTYVTEMHLANATNAAYLTSIFWGGLTVGRLVAIPLAMRFKPQQILRADFAGALVSLLAMLLWPHSLVAVIVTSAGLGFAVASIYPTTMSYSGQLMTLSGKTTGLFAIGNSTGMMLVPWVIGQFFESTGPQSLTIVLVVDLLVALFVLLALARWTKSERFKELQVFHRP
jgi:MFS transporter, FHS family, Na+ dependent glucose transporter 1